MTRSDDNAAGRERITLERTCAAPIEDVWELCDPSGAVRQEARLRAILVR